MNRLVEAVLMCTYNLCFEQKYEKYQNFLSETFHFLGVKFSVYLNRLVIVMKRSDNLIIHLRHVWILKERSYIRADPSLCWARRVGSNGYLQSMFGAEIWKILELLFEIFSFWWWNFEYIWKGVFSYWLPSVSVLLKLPLANPVFVNVRTAHAQTRLDEFGLSRWVQHSAALV